MIFVLAGTGDARELAIALNRAGFPLLASVATDNAARSLLDAGIPTRVGKLTATEMVDLWKDKGVRMVVDASHPFAEEAHRHAMRAAETFNVPYLRFERAVTRYDGPITWVAGYEEAADVAFEKKGSIFLATGGKTLAIFARRLLGQPDIRLVVRLLPRVDNMEQCAALGIPQRDIVAMQGPFSRELNHALFRHFETTLMVTKDSGEAGGVDEKIEAAWDLGIEVVMIERPPIAYGRMFSDADALIWEVSRQYAV
ncbi:precorrin-6x reductase [Sulfobacillus acidophilus TPY]|uniref:Precorrin-6x reductase n=1 Tax=Sulfobacillus acidophilus (strain ATCC 700253 / DSM 10332 / NAL) TaxID=679936 RepID=G8TU87_SULAD|nr:precorrin-6x reductase [Sulfobacillus acidophilus TPY]AEW05759.1 precorrin-6x reductase [Sulfobacillus acidophilus DSM 10332]